MELNISNPVFLDLETTKRIRKYPDEKFLRLESQDKYYISNYGNLYSEYRKRTITPALSRHNRLRYQLKDTDGTYKNYFAHRLVAQAWIKNDESAMKKQVHHIDHNTLNNHISNLAWVNSGEHRLIDANKKLYLYDIEKGEFVNFKNFQSLQRFLVTDKKLYNRLYYNQPDFIFFNGFFGWEISDVEYNGLPLYLALENTAPQRKIEKDTKPENIVESKLDEDKSLSQDEIFAGIGKIALWGVSTLVSGLKDFVKNLPSRKQPGRDMEHQEVYESNRAIRNEFRKERENYKNKIKNGGF